MYYLLLLFGHDVSVFLSTIQDFLFTTYFVNIGIITHCINAMQPIQRMFGHI